MPMNLDSVGCGLRARYRARGRRRTRCSTRSVSARARPTRPVSSSSSRPRTARTSPQRVLPTLPGDRRRWARGAMPSFGDINWAMLVHGEQAIEVFGEIPPDGTVESVTTIVGHLRQGLRRARGDGDRLEVRRHRASPRSRCASARSSAVRAASATAAARASPPVEGARTRARRRGHLRDAHRPGVALPPLRRPQPAALRPGVRRAGRLPEADPPRPVHLRLHRPGVAARAVRLRPGALPRAWTPASASRSCPATCSRCACGTTATGSAIFQTVTQDGTVVIDGGVFDLRRPSPAACMTIVPDTRRHSTERLRATRAAPMERAVGAEAAPATMRVPAQKSSRHGRRARPARRRRTARRSRARPSPRRRRAAGRAGCATDATARPTSVPRALDRLRRRGLGGGRPVIAAIAVPDASASRQPRAPQPHGAAVGLDDHVADVAGVAVGAVEQPAVEDDAAADAGRHDHREVVAHAGARRRSTLRRARAPWRRCRPRGRPVCACEPARAAGSRATPGCSPATRARRRRASVRRSRRRRRRSRQRAVGRQWLDHGAERGEELVGVLVAAVSSRARATIVPASSTIAAASFVPPDVDRDDLPLRHGREPYAPGSRRSATGRA